MRAALTGHVTHGISNRPLNKYYFPPLKVGTLLGSMFIGEPFLRGDGAFMSGCACGPCTCESLPRLSRVWITVGKPERMAFDFHWFKLASNCCGDPVGDSFMSCLFKFPFFPPDQNGPVYVRFPTPPHTSSPGWRHSSTGTEQRVHVRQVKKEKRKRKTNGAWIIVVCVLALPESWRGSCLICSVVARPKVRSQRNK